MHSPVSARELLHVRVQELRRVATEDLGRVEGELQREAREDAELRQRYGRAWARPASAALNSTLLEKVAGAPVLHSGCIARVLQEHTAEPGSKLVPASCLLAPLLETWHGLPCGYWKGPLTGAGYKANLVAAGESDARLEARLQQQQAAFGALSLDHAVAQMPRLQARPWLLSPP